MKLYKKNIAMLMAGLLALSSGALVTSCDDDDDYDTNQFSNGGVSLTAASLQVTRGAFMTFKGTNLNRVSSVEFPGGVSSTPEVVDQYTIKALVPEGAEVGTVKLIYDGGELETKQIAFTEPITFEEFAPAEVKAGDVLTVKGTYLTYIDFVKFATGENVEVKNDNRTELKVTVPVDASTGKFELGYYSVDGQDTVETLLQSAEVLTVAGPENVKITTPTVKAGEKVVFTGSLLRLVNTVKFAGAEAVSAGVADPTKDVESLSVALPAEAQDGEVTLVLRSGLEVSAGQLKTVVPTAAIKDKKASYGIGDVVVIEGENLDLITNGFFAGTTAADTTAAGESIFEAKDGNILLTVTAAAKSGDITLGLANGSTITVAGFETSKPVFTFPTSATPLDVLNVESTLASRVSKVTFGGVEASASVSKAVDGFSVQVPLEAESGKVVVIMDNGEEVVIDNFTVNAYTFCAVKAFDAEQTTIGDLLKCTVKNAQSLTAVKLNGKETGYILNDDLLFVNVGQTPGNQRMVLVSDETEVEYVVKVVGKGLVETIVYDTPIEVAGWGGVNLPVKFPVPLPSGALVRIRVAQANSELQVMDGYWGMGANWAITDDAKKNTIKVSADALSAGYVDLDLSVFHDENDNPWWDGSMMFNADGVIISSVGYVIDYSAPTAIWTGEFSNAGWAGNQDLAWGGYDWSLVEAGQTLYFSVQKVEAGKWACLSLRHGNGWGALVDAVNAEGKNQYDLGDDVDATTIEFTLTQAAIDDLVANGGLVMTGDNLIITKVAIK